MKEKFTQGGWYLEFDNCDEEGFLEVAEFTGAILDSEGNGIGHIYSESNARLIAASPDLYAVLKAIINDLPISRDWLDPVNERWAKDALKKARGES